jgi:hypothetical protein
MQALGELAGREGQVQVGKRSARPSGMIGGLAPPVDPIREIARPKMRRALEHPGIEMPDD